MDIEEAVNFIDQLVATIRLTRAEHIKVIEAIQVIKKNTLEKEDDGKRK